MTSEISVTYGTYDVLTRIIDDNPQRQLHLFQELNDPTNLMLLDSTGTKSIFNSSIIYDVLGHSGVDNWDIFVNSTVIELNDDQQKVFDARINKLLTTTLPQGMLSMYSMYYHKDITRRALLTTWDSEASYKKWQKQADLSGKYHVSPDFYMHVGSYIPPIDEEEELETDDIDNENE